MMKGNKLFEDIYEEERKFSRTIILSVVKNEDIADDVCEDVFARLYEMGEALDTSSRAKVHALITTMSFNQAVDYLRKASVFREVSVADYTGLEMEDSRNNPEAVVLRMEEDEFARLVFQKMRRDNPMYYETYVKVKYMGRSPRSVAKELGISVTLVNARLHRAKRWFKKEMKKLYRE